MILSVSPDHMKRWEDAAFCNGTDPWRLVQNAASAVLDLAKELIGSLEGKNILIVCGPGNNGADGYACARLFRQEQAFPYVVAVEEAKTKLAIRAQSEYESLNLPVLRNIPENISFDLVIDAIYGIGFRGSLSNYVSETVCQMNALSCPILSVDIPSGVEGLTGAFEHSVMANATLSMQCHKHGVLLAPKEVVGALHVADIGLFQIGIPNAIAPFDIVYSAEAFDLKDLLPSRKSNAHKGDCGRALLVVGSMGMVGAASTAAKACLRGGAGLTTIECDMTIMPFLQTIVPEAMCTLAEENPQFDAVLIGCGWGKSKKKFLRIQALLKERKPTVLDADALNMIAETPLHLGKQVIITPHLGEAARLLGVSVGAIQRNKLEACLQLHEKYGCSVLLKDAVSVLYDGNKMSLNVVGTPALAKGGSGDLLAGLLCALLAQNRGENMMRSMQAACLWMGMAAQKVQGKRYQATVISNDIIEALGYCCI